MSTVLAPAGANPLLSDGAPPLGDSDFAAIARIMQTEARIHLPPTKKVLVHSRLARRLRDRKLASFKDYIAFAESDPEELRLLVTALTTNHTHFFRESHHFDHLRDVLMPQLKSDPSRAPVRMWSAGCSSGEEVYTLAMTLLGPDRSQAEWMRNRDVRLLATDISEPVVKAAAEGFYPAGGINGIPDSYLKAWMVPENGGYRMAEAARALVTARVLNLFGDWPMRQRYDAIFCRNVMIYFDDTAKAELEARLVELLKPGGFLYIGHSERLIGPAVARMRSCGNTIYQRTDGAA
ncbi:chemotaxis protein methyltransferase CheR [Sphingomonas sp. BE123]|jgi:chemotaxis protein methyltransferase CheR|uniref:CheR family methyltransferase n=1 Tax=unclassified Sphingomonas TaxID=196159 RepID=UPI00285BD7DF|nr:protein-glutamate O-methyltransferase CheR [Sphingomonas sp. BE123]MDR6853482.1 chemotaxis protein methyltransferase CheR [Sphingomonas sp. BE123]